MILVIIGLVVLINSHFLIFLDLNEPEQYGIFIFDEKSEKEEIEIKEFISPKRTLTNRTSKTSVFLSNETYENNKTKSDLVCFPLSEQYYFFFLKKVWIWIDSVLFSLVPFIIISVCSMTIAIRIKKQSESFLRRKTNQNLNEKAKKRNTRRT